MASTESLTSAKSLKAEPAQVFIQRASNRGRPPSSLTLLVGQIDGKLDQLLANLVPQVNDQEDRIRDLEVWRGWTKGGGAALFSLIAVMEALRYSGLIK